MLTILKRWLPSLLLASLPALGQTNDMPLPNNALPNEGDAAFTFKTLPNSFQIYTCGRSDGTFAWTNDPDAFMTDRHGLRVHHYHGPTWEMSDGSTVHSQASLAKHYLPVNSNSIHWLELPGQDGTKQFAKITLIQRVDTEGGVGPAPSECGAANVGKRRRKAYSATYRFFAK